MEEIKIDYLQAPLEIYLSRLASGDPVPGGGSAAALVLSLSASLLSMVANFTIGKKRFAQFEPEAKEILERTESIRKESADLVEEDSRVYLKYRQAAAMDKADPNRTPALFQAVRDGNILLLKITGLTREVLQLAKPLLEKGNPYLVSDVACAAALVRSAYESAEMNILINFAGQPGLEEEAGIKEDLNRIREVVFSESGRILSETKRRLSKTL
ncbi:MAG: cyclodeaminase/cyclohydrolase family protein [Candidatus Omnitrophota bacterium]